MRQDLICQQLIDLYPIKKPLDSKLKNINRIKIDDFINILIPDINSKINLTIIGGGIQIKERKEDICSWINSKKII